MILEPWSKKEKVDSACLNGWFDEFCDIVKKETEALKLKYPKKLNRKSVFKDDEESSPQASFALYFGLQVSRDNF